MTFISKEAPNRQKKQVLLISVAILSLLVVAVLAGTLKDASAQGAVTPSNPNINLYFRGDSIPHKLGNMASYGLLTIKYDGDEIVRDKRIFNNAGFGGVTSGQVKTRASVYVKIKVYDNKDNLLGSQEWTKNLNDGDKPDFWYSPTPYWAFEMHLSRSNKTVTVQFL